MNKLIFLFTLMCSVLLVACQSDDVPTTTATVADEAQIEEQMNQVLDAMLTDDQLAVIARLEAINDSVAAEAQANDMPETRATPILDFSSVISADARGFKEGWRQGFKHGGGLVGKLTAAAITAVVYSVSYSIEYIYKTCKALGYFVSVTPMSPRATYTEMAYRWENGEVDALAELMVSEDPSILQQGTYEEFKLSVWHNAVILNHEDGVLLPSGPAENLYSPEQLLWFESDNFLDHYNNIPRILSSETATYVSAMYMPYESRIAAAYVTGLRQLGQLSVSQTYNSSKDLCKEYTKVVQDDSSVNEEAVGNLISTFYMGPVSMKCWESRLGL